ncbi:MAG: 2-isopropylmalate synthase, partial [Myxococcales bacterium]|nr:2-isopropylmalate synthase [Myxococcales bacterium]
RAGNAAMDQLLVNLHLLGAFDGDLTLLPEYCAKVSAATDTPISRQYPVFGADAFDTATGVHAAAVVKALRTGDQELADQVYSGVPAGAFGLEQRILVGHMSGKSNVLFWLERHGIEASDELVDKILTEAKASRRPLDEAPLRELAGA